MSPELETLDQLITGDMPLSLIRTFYPDCTEFVAGVSGLLTNGDVCLRDSDKEIVPEWRWKELMRTVSRSDCDLMPYRLEITDKGAARIA